MNEKIDYSDISLLNYIYELEKLFLPNVYDYKYNYNITIRKISQEEIDKITSNIPSSQCRDIFMSRFNNNELNKFSYDTFRSNPTIRSLIKELGLKTKPFWYLVLFVSDYCSSMFLNGITMKLNPIEQIEELIEAANDKEDKAIIIQTGKKKLVIEDARALEAISEALEAYIKNISLEELKYLGRRLEDTENTKQLNLSPIIAYFGNMLLDFFSTQPQIVSQRKKGARHSIKETDLICQMVYYTKLSQNKSFLESENDILKAYLKQYKTFKYPNNISMVYPEVYL